MPKPLVAVALVSLLTLVLAAPVTADDPDPAEFVDAAEGAGLACEPYDTGSGGTQFLCSTPIEATDRYWSANVDPFDLGMHVAVGRNVFAGGFQPAEADVLALMRTFISLALGDEAQEALDWLDDMNDGPQREGQLQIGDWDLQWFTDEWVSESGDASGITLDLNEWRTAPPSIAPAPPLVAPSLAPVDRPRSSVGEWTYTGTWTMVAAISDFPGSELEVGAVRPDTLTITCRPEETGQCHVVYGIDFPGFAEIVEPGRLRRVVQLDEDACPGGRTATITLEIAHGPERASATYTDVSEPRTCVVDGEGGSYAVDYAWVFEGALTGFVAFEEPSATLAPAPSPAPVPVGPNAGNDGGPAAPIKSRSFEDSVPTIAEVSSDPMVLLQSGLLAALVVFLMPFPAQLFNSTLETHEAEVKRWFRLDRLGAIAGGIGDFWTSWPGVAVFILLTALLYGFLDPGFGISLGSLATFVGMLLGIVLVTAAFAIPAILAHRRIGDAPALKVVPVSLLIGVACVLLSRLTDFQPGYLYGLLIGLVFARELSEADEGRATAIGAGLMLLVALASWLALGVLPPEEGFATVVARTSLAALMVAGLEGVVFGLLPMRFLPGEPLYAWNRALWGGLLAGGAFAFFHILINPASGYLSDTSRTPLFTVIALLVGFSLVSVAFWAWFRFRGDRPPAEGVVA